MLDMDLAVLYETETRVLNFAVKRNIQRFPADFMFQLTLEEFEHIQFQAEALETNNSLRSQIVTSKGRGGRRYLPYAFTEQGIAMLSGVLNSERAINMNIAIMRAFVEVRRALLRESDLREQLKVIKERMGVHDAALGQIYDAIENLLDKNASQRKWENRERIGFKK
ncbi:MAG TPA: ORF6N domain-containing protein [Chitinophagaceae bacterium]|nr:ORF6N domain-containing protein [Chitinophagaceae bacterium]